MTVRISSDDIATFCAKKWLSYQGVEESQQKDLLPTTKYNVLVQGFRASTVLLVSAIAATALLAFSAACSFAFIGLCARYATEQELVKYTLPARAFLLRELEAGRIDESVLRVANNELVPAEKIVNLFGALRLGNPPEGWVSESVVVCDKVLWMNTLPEVSQVAEGWASSFA